MKSTAIFLVLVLALSFSSCAHPRSLSSSSSLPPVTGRDQGEQMPSSSDRSTSCTMETTVDLSDCFQGVNGCAVVYSPSDQQLWFYQESLCRQQVSPFSTFKIISALLGLEAGMVKDETSTMDYNGIQYANSAWNDNLTLAQAFSSSCIWYFRQVIDAVGLDAVQQALDSLSYGNCDISQWEGSGVNQPEELNGFWLDSSLRISPLEQVQVLASIFEGNSSFSSSAVELVSRLMLVEENDTQSVYGKTGTGSDGRAWFVGFSQKDSTRRYFAVYLDDGNDTPSVSGSTAKEIALRLDLWAL